MLHKSVTMLMLLVLLGYSGKKYTKTFESSYDIGEGCKLYVAVEDGNIEIEGWDNDKVEIKGELSVWATSKDLAESMFERLDIHKAGKSVHLVYKPYRVEAEELRCGGTVIRKGAKMNCKVFVPISSDIELKLDDGIISIKRTNGDINIHADDVEVSVDSVSCDKLEIANDDGEIEITNVRGKISIETEDTDVRLRDVQSLQSTVVTDDGEVDVAIVIQKGGKYKFVTDDGDIIVRLPADTRTGIVVQKDDGQFESELPILIHGSIEPHHIMGVIGEEAANIYILTDDGNVFIKKLTE